MNVSTEVAMDIGVHDYAMKLQLTMKLLRCFKNLRRFRKMFVDLYSVSSFNLLSINQADPTHMEKLGKKFDKLEVHLNQAIVQKIFWGLARVLYSSPNNKLSRYKLQGRELASIFIFAGYPEFSLEFYRGQESLNTIQGRLHLTAKKTIQLWMKIVLGRTHQSPKLVDLHDTLKFIEHINLFTFYYVIHMNNDRMYKINQLFIKWYNEEHEKDTVDASDGYSFEKKKEVIRVLNRKQTDTLKMIKRFYKEFDENILVKYKQLVQDSKDITYKTFWEKIKNDLDVGKNESFLKVLIELRSGILNLIPSCQKKQDILKEMNEQFDIPFIKLKLDHKCFEIDFFTQTCEYLLQVFEMLQSNARTPIMKKKWKQLISNSTDDDTMTKYKKYLSFMFTELDDVHESISTMNVLNSLGINVFEI